MAGEGGQRVADRAGAPVQGPGDLACPAGSGVVGEVLGYLAAQLAVAEPALGGGRGGGGSGGGHRDYLRKGRGGIEAGIGVRTLFAITRDCNS